MNKAVYLKNYKMGVLSGNRMELLLVMSHSSDPEFTGCV